MNIITNSNYLNEFNDIKSHSDLNHSICFSIKWIGFNSKVALSSKKFKVLEHMVIKLKSINHDKMLLPTKYFTNLKRWDSANLLVLKINLTILYLKFNKLHIFLFHLFKTGSLIYFRLSWKSICRPAGLSSTIYILNLYITQNVFSFT